MPKKAEVIGKHLKQKTIIVSVVALGIIYFLHDFLILLFIAFLLTTAFLPIVRWLKDRKVPRVVSSLILILLIFIIPGALIWSLGPVVNEEVRRLIDNWPTILDDIETRFGFSVDNRIEDTFKNNDTKLFDGVLTLTYTLLKSVAGLTIVLVLAAYWLIYYEQVRQGLLDHIALDKNKRKFLDDTFKAVETRLGTWVKGQILISFVIGFSTWIVLLILGVPYAGVLALIAAILELIPTLGPILSAVPAALIALTVSTQMFFIVVIAYIVIQQVESYFISPKLMGHVVKLNPFVVLVVVLIGTQLIGIIGALIAVPVTITAHEILLAYRSKTASNS